MRPRSIVIGHRSVVFIGQGSEDVYAVGCAESGGGRSGGGSRWDFGLLGTPCCDEREVS